MTAANLLDNVKAVKDTLAVVLVRADLKNQIGGREAIQAVRALGVPVAPYWRDILHYRFAAGPGAPAEYAVRQLVEAKDAMVRNASGQIMVQPSGNDYYIIPWAAGIAEEHARITREMVWDSALYDFLFVDALPMGQIYATPAGAADYDRNGKPNVQEYGWKAVSDKQYAALSAWWSLLKDIPMVANNASEVISFSPWVASNWLTRLGGAMSEDLSFPTYPGGDETKQGPAMSLRWAMHVKAIREWRLAGKVAWLGDKCRNFGLLPAQAVTFSIATALLTGAYIATDANPLLVNQLGAPKDVARSVSSGISIDDCPVAELDNRIWERTFTTGKVQVNPAMRTGVILP